MPAIRIEGLSKKYLIGHQKRERYTALRDVMMHTLRGIGERLRHPLSPNRETTDIEEFWALRDIDLEIEQGDRVGIIGRNGAGKSTLLKVLSRITEPTSGRITIEGRIASLLEVGTGFHPELSGRENIYLNGAILGMSRAEIQRKFDEIVAFSGVEKFLDTPVKRYSSGMYVRLAFAVAAHLEPEILVVDEVLAVGDAEFQKKCLGKMEDVAKGGRTVLFVSHNMNAIRNLCGRSVLLSQGRLIEAGPTDEVIEKYASQFQSSIASRIDFKRPDTDTEAYPIALEFHGADGRETAVFGVGEPWKIDVIFKTERKLPSVIAGLGISTVDGVPIMHCYSRPRNLEKGVYRAVFSVDIAFSINEFIVHIGLSSLGKTLFHHDDVGYVSVIDSVNSSKRFIRPRTKSLLLPSHYAEILPS